MICIFHDFEVIDVKTMFRFSEEYFVTLKCKKCGKIKFKTGFMFQFNAKNQHEILVIFKVTK